MRGRTFLLTLYRYTDIMKARTMVEMMPVTLKDMLKQRNMSMYALSHLSHVPMTTINDLCSGKTRIERCSGETLYKLAGALKVPMEDLLKDSMAKRSSFDVFKSNICHQVKDMGDIDFIIETLKSDDIRMYYDRKWYPECFYLLAMVDYLCRENDLPVCSDFNDIRAMKLSKPLLPMGVQISDAIMKNHQREEQSYRDAIPEFMRFNIVESEVRNVY